MAKTKNNAKVLKGIISSPSGKLPEMIIDKTGRIYFRNYKKSKK